MKRDPQLIRKLLLFFDEKQDTEHIEVPPIDGYDELTIKYHLVLLHDAGYLTCEPFTSTTSDRVIYVLPFDLTWNGHEFLDQIRNEHVWDEVMKAVREKGFLSASVGILKKLADKAIRKRLDLS